MKKIKVDHRAAELIRAGTQMSTWRLYDDKDISVNDQLEIIDKVDAKSPATWVPIGNVQVTSVIEKRLGDVVENDFGGRDAGLSQRAMLQAAKNYYGTQVSADTPVKIVGFTALEQQKSDETVVEITPKLQELKLYADGGSRGNPGPSASGYAILDMNNSIVVKKGIYLGVTTNNQAEYQALKFGLEDSLRMEAKKIHVYMDSLLVVNQMLGIFKVKNRDLWPIHDSVTRLVKEFDRISFTHVPRELNKVADRMVNETLDEAADINRAPIIS